MKFDETPIEEAVGAILAHSVRLAKATLKKGRVLSADDITALRTSGHTQVVAARLDPDDVGEDAAAARVASACVGDNVSVSAAFTGRCNLFADTAGVMVTDPERVARLNLVDESITIATIAQFMPVAARDMLATIKIIPFAASRGVVNECARIAADGGPLLRVAAFRPMTAGMILTTTAGLKPSILDRTVEVTRARIEALGGTLAADNVLRVGHVADDVEGALHKLFAKTCEMILISGASAIVDRRDVIPAAIVASGGEIDHFGMPVDPGNLMLVGHRGPVAVLGLPGCARSPKLNGIDWILERLFAGLPVGRTEIMRMGAGGLLKDVSLRPLPREAAVRGGGMMVVSARAPKIAALVLAAGLSRRMGPVNKLLAVVDGAPMLAHVIDAVASSKVRPVIVVLGHEADRIRAALAERNVTFVDNPDYANGLAASLKRGIAALPSDVDGAVICLGDMPDVRAAHIDRLIAAFDPIEGRSICVPTFNGKRGNPVLFDRRYFTEMASLSGDTGARHMIGAHAEAVCEVAMGDEGVLIDLDTPEALTAHVARGRSAEA